MHPIVLTCLLIVGSTSLFAQTIFETYPNFGNKATNITANDDGFLLEVNDENTNAIRQVQIDPAGNVLSEISYFENSADFVFGDGHFYAVGTVGEEPERDIQYSKYDSNGDLIWEKTIERSLDNFPVQILPLRDGNLLIGGITEVPTDTLKRFFLVKTTADGNVLWQNMIPKAVTQYDRILGYILGISSSDLFPLKTPVLKGLYEADDGFLIRNSVGSNGGGILSYSENLIKTDAYGKVIWNKEFLTGSKNISNPVPSSEYNRFGLKAVDFYEDGSTLIAYNTKLGTASFSAARLMKIDNTGEIVFSDNRGNGYNEPAYPLAITTRPNGGAWWAVQDQTMWNYAIGFSHKKLIISGITPGLGNSMGNGDGGVTEGYLDAIQLFETQSIQLYNSNASALEQLNSYGVEDLIAIGNDGFAMCGGYFGQQVASNSVAVPFFYQEYLNADCPTNLDGFNYLGTFEGHKYFISNEKETLATAEIQAADAGGYLLSINSLGENEFFSKSALGNKALIGLTDVNEEGIFNWADGNALKFQNFEDCDPDCNNNDSTNHVLFNFNIGAWELKQMSADLKEYFLVEINCGNPNDVKPDLNGSDETAVVPETGRAGDAISFDLEIVNSGAADVMDNYSINTFLSLDKILSDEDALLGSYTSLDPLLMTDTQVVWLNLEIPIDTEEGTYFFIFQIDASNEIAESIETNNIFIPLEQIEITDFGIDLRPENIVDFPSDGQQGQMLNFEFDLNNLGSDAIQEDFEVGLFFSRDFLYQATDIQNAYNPINLSFLSLQAGITTIEVEAMIPDTMPLGEYHIYIIADKGEVITELKEENNIFSQFWPKININGLHGPDLSINNIIGVPSSLTQESTLQFSFDVSNLDAGNLEGTHRVLYGLAYNQGAYPWGYNEYVDLGNMAAWMSKTINVEIPIPSDFFPDDYYLYIRADNSADIAETDESNNLYTSNIPIQITEASNPDLSISNLINFPNSAVQDEVIWFNFDLNNEGSELVIGDYEIKVYLSPNSYFSSANVVEVGQIITGWTPVGTIAEVGGGITVPEDLPAGEYYLIIVADSENVIAESKEQNNTFFSPNIIFISSHTADFAWELQCLENIEIEAVAGASEAMVTWNEADITYSNNCDENLTEVLFGQENGLAPGSYFPIGTSIVEYAVSGFCNETFADTTCTFEITVIEHPIIVNETFLSICETDEFPQDTVIIDTLYFDTYDSIVIVNVSVFPNYEIHLNKYTCDPFQAGTYTQIFQTINGCDSVVVVQVDLLSISETLYSPPLCSGDSIIINGIIYDENNPSGTQVFPNGNYFGCDSILHVEIAWLENAEMPIHPNLCEGDFIEINGIIYDQTNPSGIQIIENVAPNGCDSILNIEIQWLEVYEDTIQQSLQQGELYNGIPIEMDTIIIEEYLTVNGCDSTVQVEITVLPNAVNDILNEGNDFKVFPNPSNGQVVFVEIEGLNPRASNLFVFNNLGEQVCCTGAPSWQEIGKNAFQTEIKNLAAGIYFVVLQNEKMSRTEKLIVLE